MLVRTEGPPSGLSGELRGLARAAYPGLAIYDVRTMTEVRRETVWEQGFFARVMALFAASALALAAMGLSGVLLRFVASRTREIGVRRALGASSGNVVRLVVRRASAVAIVGGLVGTALASLGGRALGGLLYGTAPAGIDTLVVAMAAVTILVAGCAAVPALRALRVDPVTALRAE